MILNIDWLQIHCKGQLVDSKHIRFVHKHQTKQFQSVGVLIYKKEEIASLSMHPHAELANGGMSSDTILLKFKNKYLYQAPEKLREWIALVMSELKEVKIVGLSRLDIALDFNTFLNDYHPGKMIKDFCSEKILKNSRGQFKTEGTHNREINYHYLRFGNHNSERSIYLYNKSKEMREKEFKKHIATSWNNCSDINPEEDVWRLELSMKGNKHRLRVEIWREAVTMNDLKEKKYCLKKEVLKMDNKGKNKIDLCDCEMLEAENALTEFNEKKIVPSGFILFRCVRFEDLFEGDFLKNLYFTAIYQNFKFVVNNGTKNKTRMKDVELFDEICEYNKILSISESKDATRSNRIFIKHLHKHIQDLKGMNDVLIEDTKGGTDLDIFSPAILIEAIEQMEELKTLLTGGEKLLVNYSKAYDLIKYLQKIKQINQ